MTNNKQKLPLDLLIRIFIRLTGLYIISLSKNELDAKKFSLKISKLRKTSQITIENHKKFKISEKQKGIRDYYNNLEV